MEAQKEVCIVALGGEVRGYRARHYYPRQVKYSLADAIRGTIDDPPPENPGPIDFRPIPPPRPSRVAVRPSIPGVRPPRRPASPEFVWPSSYSRVIPEVGEPQAEHGIGPIETTPEVDTWGLDHQVGHTVDAGTDEPVENDHDQLRLPVDRHLIREFDQVDDQNGSKTPLWSRCSMFALAAFLTKVDQQRVARIEELQVAEEAEFSDQGPGRDWYG